METVLQDIRYAIRGLMRNPVFALTAIASLVLGIGASLAIFTVTDNLLLRSLPFRDPGNLSIVWETHRTPNGDIHNVVSPGNYFDWKRRNSVFESMSGFRNARSVLAANGRSEELGKQLIGAELFPILGVRPLRGRLFTAADDKPGAENVQIISYRLWQNWFGGDENIIGRKIQINSTPATIVGVMPPGFFFYTREVDLWEPLGLNPAQNYRATQGRWMLVAARLKPGVTLDRAQSQMTAIAQRIEKENPTFDTNWSVTLESLRDAMVREVKTSLLVLMGAVGLLLAVACANVSNLLLARYTARYREMAVRIWLGARRTRLIRQLLTESILLGLAGGLLGVIAARWEVRALLLLAPRSLARGVEIAMDVRVLAFAVGLSVLTGVVFGLAPAFIGSRAGLRTNDRSNIGGGARLRSWLVGAEVAVSVILLVGALLLFRSVVGLQSVNPGIDARNVLTFRVSIPAARYPELPSRTRFFARALEQIGQIPGVRSASAVSYLPFDGMAAGTYVGIGGRPPARPGEELLATIRTVMPGYFRTMGIPLIAGRDFTAADNDRAAPIRFIVNQAFVRKYLPNENPLSTRINSLMDRENPLGEIVGVVGNVKEGSVDKEPSPTVYYNHAHLIYTAMTFVVRANGNPPAITEPARRIIRGLDASQPIADVRTMESIVDETFSRQRFSALLLSGFSISALLLAAIGIYGVLAYSVTERTREIGVRVALGAQPGQIMGMIVGKGARLVIGGTAAGIAGALALTGLLKSLLFGVEPRDIGTFLTVPAILIAVALAAAYIPARRAARMNAMDALRTE